MSTARILVIDDDTDWCRTLQEPLIPLGYHIEAETEREEVLDLLLSGSFDFDVVVLNIRLSNKEDKIAKKWAILLGEIKKKNSEIIVITSEKYPPDIDLRKLMRSAYKDYNVANFIVKEKFDVEEYQNSILEALITPKLSAPVAIPGSLPMMEFKPLGLFPEARSLPKEQLIRILSLQSQWSGGQSHERRNFLLLAGFSRDFVYALRLDGHPEGSAAYLINELLDLDYMIEFPEYTPLGLIVKLLYNRVIDRESKRNCADILLKFQITKDEGFLQEVKSYLAKL